MNRDRYRGYALQERGSLPVCHFEVGIDVLDVVMIIEEFDELENGATGSRLSGRGGALTIVDAKSGRGMSKDAMIKRISERMQPRLDYITDKLEIERVEAEDVDKDDLDALREQVRDYLSVVDDR